MPHGPAAGVIHWCSAVESKNDNSDTLIGDTFRKQGLASGSGFQAMPLHPRLSQLHAIDFTTLQLAVHAIHNLDNLNSRPG